MIRPAREADHAWIVDSIGRWWSDSRSPEQARALASLVPRLFLQHFASTSFVAEAEGEPHGFLVGFLSQDSADEAYIHFVGVDPARRGGGMARELYESFFAAVRQAGRSRVHAITSPANTGSIAFHRRMGFEILPGDTSENGVPVRSDYDGAGTSRVRFLRTLRH